MSQSRYRALLRVLVLTISASSAVAQVARPVDNRVDGRILDANNQVGAGGFNAPLTSPDPNAANLFITGNVTGGRAFRGFSPIRDSSSLFLSLPTAQLGTFQRDSIGLGDVTAWRSPALVSPFYLPSSTVTSAGGVGWGVTPAASGNLGGAMAVPRVDLFTGKPLSLDLALNPGQSTPSSGTLDPRYLPRSTITTTPLTRPTDTLTSWLTPLTDNEEASSSLRLAESPLFGLPRGPGGSDSDLTATGGSGYAAPTPAYGGQTAPRSNLLERLFQTGTPASPPEVAPTLFGGAPSRDLLTGKPQTSAARSPLELQTVAPIAPLTTPMAGAGEPESAAVAEPTPPNPYEPSAGAPYNPAEFVPSQGSRYQDFQRAVRSAGASPTGRKTLPVEARGGEEAGGEETPTKAAVPAGPFDAGLSHLQQLLEETPRSFAAKVDTDLNRRIRKAEALLRQGEFYNAAGQYAMAAALAPDDPLVRLGQGHAYLAAGDYLSAVYYLTQGLERFPEVAHFKLNLYDFVSDPNILDIRRADLDTKLEKHEDFRLRFLLGYAEYYGGLKDYGRLQLQRAAEEAPADSLIARFPKMLEDVKPAKTTPQAPTP